jgi:hypothetical protein
MIRSNSSHTSTSPRVETSLPPKLDKHLLAYAAAASAAGVGLLAPQTADGKIVYTAANVQIIANQAATNLDLNNDGIADFTIVNGFFDGVRHPEGNFTSALTIYPAQAGNGVVGFLSSKGWDCAAALPLGAKIGAGDGFKAQYLPLWQASGSYTRGGTQHCPWASKHRGAFLGLKFTVGGQTHYGWAHITVATTGTVLNGYAYETVANRSISTGKANGPISTADPSLAPLPVPQPATLGILAQGSRGMSLWRREEDQVN